MKKDINDFVSRDRSSVNQKRWNEFLKFTSIDKNISEYNDPKYDWKIYWLETNDEKYGRIAVSEKYKLRRGLTMGEFYGSGIVD